MRTLLLMSSLVVVGCASSRSSTRFTSADELKKVMSQPKPAKVFTDSSVSVDTWELVGPLPDTYADAPHETQSLFAKTLLDSATAKGFRASEPLACVARQTAKFLAMKGGKPSNGLRDFFEARCGVAAPSVATRWLTGTVPAEVTDDKLLAQWGADVKKLTDEVPSGERAGIAYVREGEKVIIAISHVRDDTTIEPVSMIPSDDGFVWVRGVSAKRADSVFGAANQGRTGSAECVDTQQRAAPAFELKCPVAKDDEAAWISISAHERGRVLGFEVVRLLARPSKAAANVWKAPTLVAKQPGATPTDFVTQLNAIRSQLGARPVTLSDGQATDHHELAPFYFEAMVKHDESIEDRIALGVMAGWRVEQEIMNGTFAASIIEGTTASELLAAMLEAPGYRKSLLSPRIGVVAVGLYAEEGALGGLVSTYEPVQAPVWPDTSNKVLTALNGQRQRNGKKPVQWVLLPASSEPTYAEAVAKREYDSEEALQRFMSAATNVTKRPVRGWRIPVLDLDEVSWPEEVLSKENLEVMFVVTTERNEKDAWGQYMLLMIILEGASQPQT